MKNTTLLKPTIISITGLLFGLILGRTDIFTMFYLVAATGFVALTFLLAKLFDYFTKNPKPVVSNYFGLIFLTFTITIVTSLVTMNRIANSKQELAESFILKIENYKKEHSQYPAKLTDLNTTNTDKFNYSTDSTRQNFRISFLVDGWHYSAFDSKDNKWTSGD